MKFIFAAAVLFFSIASTAQNFVIPKEATIRHFTYKPPLKLGISIEAEVPIFYGVIRDDLQNKFGRPKQVRSVYYPFSSFDVSLPVTIFPGAEIIFLVDDHPAFGGSNLPDTAPGPRYRTTDEDLGVEAYLLAGGKDRYIGPKLMGEILRYVPKGRILSVSIFRIPWESLGSRVEDPPTHMVITFDEGPNTLKKRIIYINAFLDNRAKHSWWFNQLNKIQPEAFFQKADQGVAFYGFDEALRRWLESAEGFAIFDFALPRPLLEIKSGAHLINHDIPGKKGHRFGYNDVARIFKFSR